MCWLFFFRALGVVTTWSAMSQGASAMRAGPLPSMTFKHRVALKEAPSFVMMWTPYEYDIAFELQVETEGYVGFGFSPDHGMKGSDIMIGWVDNQNELHVQDRYALGDFMPIVDAEQNLRVLGGYQNRTHTVIRFSRDWNTNDAREDFRLTDDAVEVIWAYDRDDPSDKNSIRYHGRNRGHKAINLKNPQSFQPHFGSDGRHPNSAFDPATGIMPAGPLPPMVFKHRVVLNDDAPFVMMWTPNEYDVVFEVQVETEGYVGMGFSPDHGMRGSDIMVGWVDNQNQLHVHDRYALGDFMPIVDAEQNLRVLGGYQNGTHTVIRFSRDWITNDAREDFRLTDDAVEVIWAYDRDDPSDKNSVRYHGRNRGHKAINLKNPETSQPHFGVDVSYSDPAFDLRTGTRPAGPLPSMTFQHRVVLNDDAPFVMMWTPSESDIVFEVQVGTTGYVGFGFSPDHEMRGSDIMVGWVDNQNQLHVHDRYALGDFMPIVDAEQNLRVLGGYQNGTHTVIRFSRDWNTHDAREDFILTDDKVEVIWAYVHDDPSDKNSIRYHGTNRGHKAINLKEPESLQPHFGIDVRHSNRAVGTGAEAMRAGPLPSMTFQHRVMLNDDAPFVMMWTPNENDIVFEVQVETEGYVGIGFSPNGGMRGSDIMLGWVDNQNLLHVHDRYAHGNYMPVVDKEQNLKVLGGYQNRTHTVVRFSRDWNTCDTKEDFRLTEDTVRVIWAYGDDDPPSKDSVPYHGEHNGVKSIFLNEPEFSLPEFGNDVKTWDIRAAKVELPSDSDTFYWCKLFKAPATSRKAHIIGQVPLIEDKNILHVHHILLYECHMKDSDRHLEKWLRVDGFQCYGANMPPSWNHCDNPIMGWAVGSDGEMLPDHVGLPMGEEYEGASYYVLETHYDNPNLKQGVIDSSGLRIFYTEKLREFDAGMLVLGHTVSPTHVIPPRQKWTTLAHCSGDCTRKELPPFGIKGFQLLLHTHTIGSSIIVRQIRNGVQTPVEMHDMNYDFNYQQPRIMKEEVTILPGDAFLVECGYDSTKRRITTFGGLGTEEEMCLAFMMYYPRIDLTQCGSMPEISQIYHTMGIHQVAHEEMVKKAFNLLSDVDIDEEKENEHLQKILENRDDEGHTYPFKMSGLFKGVIALAPDRFFNTSLFDMMIDEKAWEDDQVVRRLRDQVMFGTHLASCRTRYDTDSRLPVIHNFPNYVSSAQSDSQCPRRK